MCIPSYTKHPIFQHTVCASRKGNEGSISLSRTLHLSTSCTRRQSLFCKYSLSYFIYTLFPSMHARTHYLICCVILSCIQMLDMEEIQQEEEMEIEREKKKEQEKILRMQKVCAV